MPEAKTIWKSVGRSGFNDPNDQRTISDLLSRINVFDGGHGSKIVISPIQGPDSDLIAAIETFQRRQFNGWSDGRVDPGGNTLRRMNEKAVASPVVKPGVHIGSRVGKLPSRNEPGDCDKIIDLLMRVLASQGGPDEPIARAPLPGMVSPTLVRAIEKFQRRQFGWADGIVDPNGPTLARLNLLTNNGTGPKKHLGGAGQSVIRGSVGRGGHNDPLDQSKVIGLLKSVPAQEGGATGPVFPGPLPGTATPSLVDAIVCFQKRQFAGWSDGRVDPGGNTLRRLMEKRRQVPF